MMRNKPQFGGHEAPCEPPSAPTLSSKHSMATDRPPRSVVSVNELGKRPGSRPAFSGLLFQPIFGTFFFAANPLTITGWAKVVRPLADEAAHLVVRIQQCSAGRPSVLRGCPGRGKGRDEATNHTAGFPALPFFSPNCPQGFPSAINYQIQAFKGLAEFSLWSYCPAQEFVFLFATQPVWLKSAMLVIKPMHCVPGG